MHAGQAATPPFNRGVLATRSTRLHHFWHVELNVNGRCSVHKWRGWAIDSQDATWQARNDARRTWPGCTFAVTVVKQVGV